GAAESVRGVRTTHGPPGLVTLGRSEHEVRPRRPALPDTPAQPGDGGAFLVGIEPLGADVRDALPVGVGAPRSGPERDVAAETVGGAEARALADQVHHQACADGSADRVAYRDPAVADRDRRAERTEIGEMRAQPGPEAPGDPLR